MISVSPFLARYPLAVAIQPCRKRNRAKREKCSSKEDLGQTNYMALLMSKMGT